MFPEFPADLSALTDDELSALLDGFVSVVRGVRDNDATVVGELSPVDIVSEMEAALPHIDAIRSEISDRAAAEAAPGRLEELTAGVLDVEYEAAAEDEAEEVEEVDGEVVEDDAAGDEGEADAVGDDNAEDTSAEAEAEAEQEAVVADAGEVEVPAKYKGRKRGGSDKPEFQEVFAAADIRGLSAGAKFESRDQVIEAIMSKHDAVAAVQRGVPGVFEDVPVATVQRTFPDRLMPLTADASPEVNQKRILHNIGGSPGSREMLRATGGKALTAAGSLCAPLPASYDIPVFGVTDTPVQDALPTIPATRGGIQFFQPMSWNGGSNQIGAAITHITKTQDDAGGTSAQKTYQTIACPSIQSAYVDAYAQRVRIENLKARVWPELIDAFMQNLDVAYASTTEIAALDFIKSKVTAVSAAAIGNLSALSTYLEVLIKLTAGISSRNRLSPDARFRCLAPSWLPDLLVADTSLSQFDRFRTEQEIVGQLAKADIDLTWYLDSATGSGQLFSSQAAAEVVDFPATAKLYVFVDGAFVKLDSGSLDLGVTRDSTLNTINQYELFAEEFFGFAYVGGPEAYEVSIANTPTGMTAGTMTVAAGSL